MSDPRFARFKSDPRFRRLKKHKSKVVVDDRFKSIFTKRNTKDASQAMVDKYGRKRPSHHDTDALRRFYRLETKEQEDEKSNALDYARGEVLMESSDEEQDDEESDTDGPVILGHDPSNPISLTNGEDVEVDLDEDTFAGLDAQAAAYSREHPEETDETDEKDGTKTRRLAVVNLDWDHVKATHLYKIFSSLVSPSAPILAESPKGRKGQETAKRGSNVSRGRILSVKIYPSQFGKERMAREEKEGPPVDLFKRQRDLEADEVNKQNIYEVGDGNEYDEDALRKYQIDRLRYYYAVVTCDSVEASSHIYSELEGAELEKSANVFDLSYVPDDMTFDDEPRDEADDGMVINYKGIDFVTDALRHSKVKLTWDDDDPERNQVTRRRLTKKEIDEEDFRAYIASSSESEEDSQAKKAASRDKLRALLLGNAQDLPEGWGDEGDDDDIDMQVTFTSGLNQTNPDEETTLEKYQRKLKERRKKRKEESVGKRKDTALPADEQDDDVLADDFFAAQSDDSDDEPSLSKGAGKSEPAERTPATKDELALLVASDNPNAETQHFNLKSVIKAEKRNKSKGKRKGKKGAVDEEEVQENFVIDVADERFKAIHEDHTFAIDPSNPRFKKTKSMASLLDERSSRQKRNEKVSEGSSVKTKPSERSISSLVESVKRKSSSAGNTSSGRGKRSRAE